MKSKILFLIGIILIFVLGIILQVYKNDSKKTVADETSAHAYKFESAPVDVSAWKTHNPYMGVNFKYPDSWVLTDNGPQRQLANGDINKQYRSDSYSYFNIIELSSADLEPKISRKNLSSPSEAVTKGMYVTLNINLSSNSSFGDLCTYYSSKEVDYFNQGNRKFCQVKLKNNFYAFFMVGNEDLRMEVFLNDNESVQTKNYNISVAREILKSFKS